MEQILHISNVMLWIFMLGLSCLLYLILKKTSEFLSRLTLLEGMDVRSEIHIGDLAPGYIGINHLNEKIRIGEHDTKSLLLFTKNGCSVCEETINRMLEFNLESIDQYQFYIVSSEEKEIASRFSKIDNVHFIVDSNLFISYEITQVPTIFLLDEKRRVEFIQVLMNGHSIDNIFSNFLIDKYIS